MEHFPGFCLKPLARLEKNGGKKIEAILPDTGEWYRPVLFHTVCFMLLNKKESLRRAAI